MVTPVKVKDELEAKRREAVLLIEEHGSPSKAAIASGIPRQTIISRVMAAQAHNRAEPAVPEPAIELPTFPDENLPIEQIIGYMSNSFVKRWESHKAHTWFTVKVKDKKPIGILWMGDPHLDDNGCNWPVLQKHIEICNKTPGIWTSNIGDTTNNWSGRLVHLYSKQDTSLKTAQRLAAWFMLEAGLKWLVFLIGNHDAWGDGAGVLAQMAKRYGTQQLVCHDWEARFILEFPNAAQFRIHAAHNFKGHSQWNPMHGPMKAAMLGQEAHLLVCGDKHNWGVFRFENAERNLTQTLLRVRGYKFLDDHTRHLGIQEQQDGCSILTIFDPSNPGSVLAFDDIEQGAEYLTWLRSK